MAGENQNSPAATKRATQIYRLMHKVLRLPPRPVSRGDQTRAGESKCCACHAKVAPDAFSAAPATQKQRLMHKVLRLPRKSGRSLVATTPRRQLPESQSVAPATHKSRQMHKVLRLPRSQT